LFTKVTNIVDPFVMFKKFDVTITLFVFEKPLQSSIILVEVYAWQLSV